MVSSYSSPLDAIKEIVVFGGIQNNFSLNSWNVAISCPLKLLIGVEGGSPTIAAGRSSEVYAPKLNPAGSTIAACQGANTTVSKRRAKSPSKIFENDPAASIDCCAMSDCFAIFTSSGSTNAPIIGPKNTSPVLCTGTLYARATIPWLNSCITAMRKIAISQYQNGNTPNPGTFTPGKTSETPFSVPFTKRSLTRLLISMYEINTIPIKPIPVPIYPSNMTHSLYFLTKRSIALRPNLDL